MRWTWLLLGWLVFTFLPAHAGHSPPKIILHIHVQTTGTGLSPQEATTIRVPPNGEEIQIRTFPEVTEQNLIGVAEQNGTLRLQFDHAGSVALSAVTAQDQGRILVVILNGYVMYAPVIDEQITTGELDIPHALDPRIVALLQDVAKENIRKDNKS
jgi:preprotein translocase subunit SecD